MQGKLVPQDPKDEPASVLLERIREEKARLIKEKKARREKNPSRIFRGEDNSYYEEFTATGEVRCIDDEVPFDLPDGWVWGRGRTLFLPMESTRPSGEAFIYIDVDAVNNQTHRVDNPKRILTLEAPSRASRKLHESDVLFSMVRPYLRNIALISKELSDAIASTGFYVITPSVGIYSKYLYYLVLSPYVVDGINAFMKGENSPSVNNGHIENFIYPLPPLAEQERIVAKIEELMPWVEQYGKAQSELDQLNNSIQGRLRKSVLQYALEGKLVPQQAEDGSAEELLAEIQAEKQRLYVAGKLKKKDLAHSTIFRAEDGKYYEQGGKTITCIDEEIPFAIPKSWCWVTIGNLFQHNNGKQLNKENSLGTLMSYITTSNLYWDGFKLDKLKKMPFTEQEIERCQAIKGDLLVCEGGDIGRARIWTYDYPIMLQNHIHKLRAYLPVCTKYFYYIFYLYNLTGAIRGKGIGIKGFSSRALHATRLPLPPLAEQERIAKKLDEITPLIERYTKVFG